MTLSQLIFFSIFNENVQVLILLSHLKCIKKKKDLEKKNYFITMLLLTLVYTFSSCLLLYRCLIPNLPLVILLARQNFFNFVTNILCNEISLVHPSKKKKEKKKFPQFIKPQCPTRFFFFSSSQKRIYNYFKSHIIFA